MVPPTPKGKLSFKQKHALETLPREMDKLRAEIVKQNARLATPNLYTKDPTGFAAASKALTDAEAALAKAENDWLELEMIREELEG
jgi:ATP-binding cassette subfamily F protein uup